MNAVRTRLQRDIRRCGAVAVAVVAILSLVPLSGCVSQNVEDISGEDAEAESPSPARDRDGRPAEPPAGGAMGSGEDGMPPVTGETPSGGRVAGRIEVAPELRDDVPTEGMIYVIVRVAGREGGPPLAVKRLPGRLPAEFVVTGADAMVAGTPLTGEVMVEARYDQDGAATSRSPGDLTGRVDGVPVDGEDDVVIVLDERVGDDGDAGGAGR